jgi:hypothetical protein
MFYKIQLFPLEKFPKFSFTSFTRIFCVNRICSLISNIFLETILKAKMVKYYSNNWTIKTPDPTTDFYYTEAKLLTTVYIDTG